MKTHVVINIFETEGSYHVVNYFYHINVCCVRKTFKICHQGDLGYSEDRGVTDNAASFPDSIGLVRFDRAGAADSFGGGNRCVCGIA